jgi:uncharacterized protein (TIGR02679 family)
MPAAAQRTFLQQLAGAAARLCYHGDFDWPGITIANYVIREYGARPWRFARADYEAAVEETPDIEHLLKGAEVVASWDLELAPCMRANRIAIAEEAVAGALLEDLSPGT